MSSVGFGIDDAARLAEVAHAGQVDKQGRNYFEAHLEPIATVLEQFGEQAAMAGYLQGARLTRAKRAGERFDLHAVRAEVADDTWSGAGEQLRLL